jgi:hypothetical protein
MKGLVRSSGIAVFVGLALGCAPKSASPPPAQAEVTAPPPKPPPAQPVADDRVDLKQLNQIVEDWHQAWKSKDKAAERNTDGRLMRWINQELAEDRAQTQQANQEAKGSTNAGTPKQGQDDRQDANAQQTEAEKTRIIAKKLKNMQGTFESGAATAVQYQKKSDLLRQLQKIAQRELARSREEAKEDSRQGGGGQATPNSGGPKPAASSGGSSGGGEQGSSGDKAEENIGPKKLVAAINQWLKGRTDKTPKKVKEADARIKSWWKQELARGKPWTPRSKEIALALKKMQPAFNKNEATPAQWAKKKDLLTELRKIANARMK